MAGSDMNFISLFSGGGGADIGAIMAGYTPIAANEHDPAIAAVYAENIGDHVRVGDILAQDPHNYPACDLLHASPPCPNFSVAKTGAKESEHDIALAEKVAEFIRVLAPRAVTIENVPVYRKSESYRIILRAIEEGGYMYDAKILNSADYGVPQTRQRLIVRATQGLLYPMPQPVQWVGWYEAIEDLIDTLPESKFANWQLARLPQELTQTTMAHMNESRDHNNIPYGKVSTRRSDQPANTVTQQVLSQFRAFLMPNANSSSAVIRNKDEPAPTIGSIERVGNQPRAWIETGRVVKMTPRALARFQSFPDWYKLPDKASLACRIIGNAVPPLMYMAVARSLKEETA